MDKTNSDARAQSLIDLTQFKMIRSPAHGQFVITGPQQRNRSALDRLGFCVQIRKAVGQYGTDMVFLRHADGRLVTHENQFFSAMTEEQERLARELFEMLPEEEDLSVGYSCCAGVREVGFLIENSTSPAAETQTAVTVTVKCPDGSATVTTFC